VWGFKPQMITQVLAVPKGSTTPPQRVAKYIVMKYLVISDLGKLKLSDICEILDKAQGYGAIGVAELPPDAPEWVASATTAEANVKVAQTKGVSKNNIDTEVKATDNEFINYHFNEATLEKLIKEARDKAVKDAKEKLDLIKKALNFKENEMNIKFTEKMSTTATEEGEMTIRIDLIPALDKADKPAAPAPAPLPGPAPAPAPRDSKQDAGNKP
jgi:hypothetical protein